MLRILTSASGIILSQRLFCWTFSILCQSHMSLFHHNTERLCASSDIAVVLLAQIILLKKVIFSQKLKLHCLLSVVALCRSWNHNNASAAPLWACCWCRCWEFSLAVTSGWVSLAPLWSPNILPNLTSDPWHQQDFLFHMTKAKWISSLLGTKASKDFSNPSRSSDCETLQPVCLAPQTRSRPLAPLTSSFCCSFRTPASYRHHSYLFYCMNLLPFDWLISFVTFYVLVGINFIFLFKAHL